MSTDKAGRPPGVVGWSLRAMSRQPHLMALVLGAMLLQASYNLVVPLANRMIFDQAIPRRDASLLLRVILTLVGGVVLRATIVAAKERWAARLAARASRTLRAKMLETLHRLAPDYFARTSTGDTMSRFAGDVAVADMAMSRLIPKAIYLTINITGCVTLMFALSWQLALVVVVIASVTLIGPSRLASRAARTSAARSRLESAILSFVQENIALQAIVRAFGLERWSRQRLDGLLDKYEKQAVEATFSGALVEGATIVAASTVELTAMGIGAWLAIRGDLSPGVLVAFVSLIASVVGSTFGLSLVIPSLIDSTTGIARIQALLDDDRVSVDGRDATEMGRLDGAIRLDEIDFGYTPDRLVLRNVTLEIPVGSSVALVGGSGSGKSSALGLLMRTYEPQRGRVLYGGRDVRQTTLLSLRSQVAYVPQESLLFDISVRENIRLGRVEATDAEVEAAAKGAQMHEMVMAMPEGYDTMVGERGSKLSGGQRQRVAIARAILRDPAILVLDEATSALDPATEAAIGETLEALARGRTVISVTHRLSSVVKSDRIFVFSDGELREQGTHEELLRRGGVYHALWSKQSGIAVSADGAEAHVDPARLGEIPLFAGLPPDALAAIAALFTTVRFEAERTIFERGDPGDAFYVVARGTLVAQIPVEGGEDRARVMTEGDHLGEIALLRDLPRTAMVRTRTPCVLLALPRQHFLTLLRERPQIAAAIEAVAAARLAADARAA